MKKSLCFALLVSFAAIAFAQPAITTQQLAGGSADDRLYAMCLSSDGGYIAAGWSTSSISFDKTQNNRGRKDYWIVKYNKSGKIQWDKTLGGSLDDDLRSIKQTKDSGYILGGASASGISGDKTAANKGSYDYWIIKLDKNGNVQWQKTVGGDDQDWVTDVQQTTDNGYVIGGWSMSNISGDKTQNSFGYADYWVVKLDSLGSIQWQKTIGGSNYDNLSSIQQTKDGGYILGGTSSSVSTGNKTTGNQGGDDYWIVKLDSTGVIQWQKTIGGSNEDDMTALQQTKDGGYVLGGYSNSGISGNKTGANRGVYDYWVVKVDNTGVIQWQTTVGGSDDDELTSLQQTSDSGYVMVGFSSSNISHEKTENSRGYYDYWIVKLNKTGSKSWDKTIGGGSYDYAYSIKEIKANYYNIAGFSNSQISGDKTTNSKGINDYWIVQLKYTAVAAANATSRIVANEITKLNEDKRFLVYPNPAKDVLHVKTPDLATVVITDGTGRMVIYQVVSSNGNIDISHLIAGVYYLKNTTTTEIKKIVVMK